MSWEIVRRSELQTLLVSMGRGGVLDLLSGGWVQDPGSPR